MHKYLNFFVDIFYIIFVKQTNKNKEVKHYGSYSKKL